MRPTKLKFGWLIAIAPCLMAWGSTYTPPAAIVARTFSAHYGSFAVPLHHVSDLSLSYEGLVRIVEGNHLLSIEQLLEWLKHNGYEDYLKSFVLMSHSESAQAAGVSPTRPRIILHKDRLILGLSGEPGDAYSPLESERFKELLFRTLEVIEFDERSATWRFRRIIFPESGRGPQRNLHPLRRHVARYDRDDSTCKGCHGNEPRPIWASYDLWPGAYGGGGASELVKEDSVEGRNLRAFLEALTDDSDEPDETYDRYRSLAYQYPFRAALNATSEEYGLAGLPNHHLFVHLSYLNYLRIMRILERQGKYARYKFAMLAAFAACEEDPLVTFLPPVLKTAHDRVTSSQTRIARILRAQPTKTLPAALLEDTRTELEEEYQSRVDRFNEYNFANASVSHFEQTDPERGSARLLAQLRYLFEGQGVDMRPWSLSFSPGRSTYSYNFGVSNSNYFTIYMFVRDIFIPRISQEEPLIAEYLQGVDIRATPTRLLNFPRKADFCRYLKQRSLRALTPDRARGTIHF